MKTRKLWRLTLALACGALMGATDCGEGCTFSLDTLQLEAPGTLYVGEWKRIAVTLPATATYGFDDVEFSVGGADGGGTVSASKDAEFDEAHPTVMVLAGYAPGSYTLRASVNGALVAEQAFEVTAQWSVDAGLPGPAFWFAQTGEQHFTDGGTAWGGSPDSVQNVNVMPQVGTRRLALLFVDFQDKQFPAGQAEAVKKFWLDNAVNGVNDPAIGPDVSVRRYYEEVSRGLFTISADAFGPYTLPKGFDFYLGVSNCAPQPFIQAAITAADDAVDFRDYQSVIVVSPAFDLANGKAAWPCATSSPWNFKSADGDLAKTVISMPHEWEQVDCRRVYQTLSHELGHNLGLGDQYTPGVGINRQLPCIGNVTGQVLAFNYGERNPNRWELMAFEGFLPHVGLAHKLRLGWVRPEDVQRMDPLLNPGPMTVSLSPVELGLPAAGRKIGAEFRIANGWNYYLEYRKGQDGGVGDVHAQGQLGPAKPGAVLAEDFKWATAGKKPTRPEMLLLAPTSWPADGGDFLDAADEAYLETDTLTQKVLQARLVATPTDDEARVELTYAVTQPDPSIRPWPLSGPRAYQSPDIEVVNAKSQADPAWANVPWAGNPNTVFATVTNNGTMDAAAVEVTLRVKSYNVGSTGESIVLGTEVHDVPAGASVRFQAPWTPPSEGHWCIEAVISPWSATVGGGTLKEVATTNNTAQSNYDRFYSAVASPAERVVREVVIGNPLDQPARVYFTAAQSNPEFRTYLEHHWLDLAAHEDRAVKVMFEYAGQTDSISGRLANEVLLTGWVIERGAVADPGVVPRQAQDQHHRLGGAHVSVLVGLKTTVAEFTATVGRDALTAGGVVRVVRTGAPVSGGTVLVRADRGDGRLTYKPVVLGADGAFQVQVPGIDWKRVKASYVAQAPNADSESDEVQLQATP